MKKMLIVTTLNDLSIPYFKTCKLKSKIDISLAFFSDDDDCLNKVLIKNTYDYIYIRDPFNYIFSEKNIKSKIKILFDNSKESVFVDNLDSIKDIYYEDKWLQYEDMKGVMPKTNLLKTLDNIDLSKVIIKKRLSSRTAGIVKDVEDIRDSKLDEYIIQDRIKIIKEYRVNCLFGSIDRNVCIKEWVNGVSLKITSIEEISKGLIEFSQGILEKLKFDFIGLDVADTPNGFKLIEVNRSCQFNPVYRIKGVNLAENFIDRLLAKQTI